MNCEVTIHLLSNVHVYQIFIFSCLGETTGIDCECWSFFVFKHKMKHTFSYKYNTKNYQAKEHFKNRDNNIKAYLKIVLKSLIKLGIKLQRNVLIATGI